MAAPSKDALKTYAVVGLALVFLTIGYFRLFHKKPRGGGSGTGGPAPIRSAIPPGMLRVPDIRSGDPASGASNAAGPRVAMRDIFSPPMPIVPEEPAVIEVDPADTAPTWVLTGVIRSGNRLIANINNRLVGVGETVEGFKVAEITPRQVTLSSSTQTVILQLTAPVPGAVPRAGTGRTGLGPRGL